MWPFDKNVNKLGDMIEPYIYEGRSDFKVGKIMWQGGRTLGRQFGPADAVEHSVMASASSAGSRMARELDELGTSLLTERAKLRRRIAEIDGLIQGHTGRAADLEALAATLLERINVLTAGQTDPVQADAEHDSAPARDSTVAETSLERLQRSRARAEARRAVEKKAREQAAKHAHRLQREHEARQELIHERQRLVAEAEGLRATIATLADERAQAQVRVSEVEETFRGLAAEAQLRWSEMERVGVFLWARFADGYNSAASKKKVKPVEGDVRIEPSIQIDAPEALVQLIDDLKAQEANA